MTVWRGIGEGSFENEEERSAAEIAELAKDGFAPARVVLSNSETILQCDQDVASTGMKDPAVDVVRLEIRASQDVIENGFSMPCGESRDLRGEDVAEHAGLLFETEEVAIVWGEDRATGFPFDAAFVCGTREDGGSSAITKEASTD